MTRGIRDPAKRLPKVVRKRQANKIVRFAPSVYIEVESYSCTGEEDAPKDNFDESEDMRNDTKPLHRSSTCHQLPVSPTDKNLKGLQTFYLGLGQYSTIPRCD